MENKEIFDNALKELEELKEVLYSQKLKYVNIIKFNLEDIKDALIKSQEQDKILEILKKNTIYYSVDENEYKIEITLTRDDEGFAEVLRRLTNEQRTS